jgi:oxygen-dependent protoporphyrinogen oxidase
LTLAYYLRRGGCEVEIFEENKKTGGLLGTKFCPEGLVESAANALLWTPLLSQLCEDLGIPLLSARPEARKRYIFRNGKPRSWPLSFFESLGFLFDLFFFILKKSRRAPGKGETVEDYIHRHFSSAVLRNLAEPALQGIYAGDVHRMSAKLLLGRVLGHPMKDPEGLLYEKVKAPRKGSVAPPKGMGELIQALEEKLISQGVQIYKGLSGPAESEGPCVWATPVWKAAEGLKAAHPELSRILLSVESLGLVSVTLFTPLQEGLKGYGCLFPRDSGTRALGVLFNSCIFEGRAEGRSETWIFGGAGDPEILNMGDEEIKAVLLRDRSLAFGRAHEPVLRMEITRWTRALPHYTREWEIQLENLKLPPGLYLHGNYLGRIGLSQILERSKLLAAKIIADLR